MTDPLSVSAAGVGFAQLAFGVGGKLVDLISRFRGASTELDRLASKVEQLNMIIIEIKTISSHHPTSQILRCGGDVFNSLKAELDEFEKDMSELREILEEAHGNSRRPSNRLKTSFNRCKFVLNKDKISEISSRLEERKSNLQLVLSIIHSNALNTSFPRFSGMLNCIQESQQRLENEATQLPARTNRELYSTQRDDDTSFFSAENFIAPRLKYACDETLFFSGSIQDASISLTRLCPDIHQIFFTPEPVAQVQPIISEELSKWCLSQFHAFLKDIFEDRVYQLGAQPSHNSNSNLPKPRSHETRRSTSQNGMQPFTPFDKVLNSCQNSSHLYFETTLVELDVSAGQLTIMLNRGFEAPHAIGSSYTSSVGRLFFLPATGSPLVGLTAMFSRFAASSIEQLRTLSTFRTHPNESKIFDYLKSRDVVTVRKILSEGLVGPNDRDEEGNSLLWYAITKGRDYDMCKVLLDRGADASDCTRYGCHAVAVLAGNLQGPTEKNLTYEEARSIICLLIQRSGTKAHCVYQYKRRIGVKIAPVGLLHCALSRRNSKIPTLDLVNLILERRPDLEDRDLNGNTPIMYAIFYTPQPALFDVVTALAKAGAKVDVLNKHGEGCLHLLLRRLSACNNCDMSDDAKSSIVDLLVMLLDSDRDPDSPIKSNIQGYTPLDAALSPTAWPLFCSALESTGRDAKKLIMELDRRKDILQPDIDIERRLEQIQALGTPANASIFGPKLPGCSTGKVCYLCGRDTEWVERGAPFDEFRSVVVDELGFGIHMVSYNHCSPEKCLQVHEEDSCHLLDYHPFEMTRAEAKNRSWRRHVAYQLWRNARSV